MAKTSGAQPGNDNAAKGKKWKDAIHYAITKDKQALQDVAKALISKAKEGDVSAIKELGDRIDGKVSQELEHSGEIKATVQFVIKDAD
jgi:isocitrate dehydrogenase